MPLHKLSPDEQTAAPAPAGYAAPEPAAEPGHIPLRFAGLGTVMLPHDARLAVLTPDQVRQFAGWTDPAAVRLRRRPDGLLELEIKTP
jgi:hypothetical protein